MYSLSRRLVLCRMATFVIPFRGNGKTRLGDPGRLARAMLADVLAACERGRGRRQRRAAAARGRDRATSAGQASQGPVADRERATSRA